MRKILFVALFSALGATSALAQSDPSMTCADYVKFAATVEPTKTGDAAADKMAADMDKKMMDYCKANPTAKASEAMEKAMQ